MKMIGKNKKFKVESTIIEYKQNIGANVHPKQIKFCNELVEQFYIDDDEKIVVNTNRCGIGKSTVIKAFLNNLVNDYFYFGTASRDKELDCHGAIVIHDSLDGLEQIAKYKGLEDRCYFMKFDKEDTETRANARMDFQQQLQEQFNYPIVLVTTQKYFKMSNSERSRLYKWKNGRRDIKIFDEKPYIITTTVIDEPYFSTIAIALEEIIKGEDKNYIINCWKKIRADLDYLRDEYSCKYDVMWIKKHDKLLLDSKEEVKRFFEVLSKYVTTSIYDKVLAIKQIYKNGCLFVSSGDKEQDNKRQFILLHNNLDNFDSDKCKCFILDATSKFDIDYYAIRDSLKYLQIDDRKETKDITIHHILTSTSQKILLENDNAIDVICRWANSTFGRDAFIATYSKKKGLYQKFYDKLDSKEIAYFGDIKGKNDWESYNTMAHIGLNRKSNTNYLQKYIILKNKDIEWNDMDEADIKKDIEQLLKMDKGIFVDEFMNKIMIQDIVVDTVQNIMRIKCRHFSNSEICNIFIVCSEIYYNIVSMVCNAVGGKYLRYKPDIFLADATDKRKPVDGKEKTNPQIIKEYLESLDKGMVIKRKDIINHTGLNEEQVKGAIRKNKWCNKWFSTHQDGKSRQYIV